MITLSAALRKGEDADPLTAAYLGSLRAEDVKSFRVFQQTLSHDSLCQFLLHKLHRAFPQLGASVRTWPRLAAELEREGHIPNIRTLQSKYRREVHVSLWKVISNLAVSGREQSAIADLLRRHGL